MRAVLVGIGVLLLTACGSAVETPFTTSESGGAGALTAAAGRVGMMQATAGEASAAGAGQGVSSGGAGGARPVSSGGASGGSASSAGGSAGQSTSGAGGAAVAGSAGAPTGGQGGASTGAGGASGGSGGSGGSGPACLTQAACASSTNRAGKCGAAIAQPSASCPVVDCTPKCPVANDYCPATAQGSINASSCEPITGADNQCDLPAGSDCPSSPAGGKIIHVQIGALTQCCVKPPVAPSCVWDADYYRWEC